MFCITWRPSGCPAVRRPTLAWGGASAEHEPLSDLDDREALERVREEDAGDERGVDEDGEGAMLWDVEHDDLLHLGAEAEVTDEAEGTQHDEDEVDVDVKKAREDVPVALHARLNRNQLRTDADVDRW